MTGRILVVDDEKDMVRLISRILEEGTKYEVRTAFDPYTALDLFRNEPFELLITDLRMPGRDGLELLEEAKRIRPESAVVILTAFATIDTAVEAVKKGAFDYLTKPFRRDRLLVTVEKAMAWHSILRENAELKTALSRRAEAVQFIGTSPVIHDLLERARQVAASAATILLTGESGTGKEVLAKYIHENSLRRGKAMVTVNCAAIPEAVLESELFGHLRGAFTGAVETKPGLVSEADGGTLFLDEIGDLSLALQTKLLRLLQNGEYRPVGSVKTLTANLRIIAATNRDLEVALADKTFREDLYYRLAVIQLKIPCLRARRSDIVPLAAHFLRKHARANRKEIRSISPVALEAICSQDFPGNARELENLVERGVVYCRGDVLDLSDLHLDGMGSWLRLPEREGKPLPFREAKDAVLDLFHRTYLRDLLAQVGGNISEAARLAGIQRQYFHRLLREAGLSGAEFRDPGSR